MESGNIINLNANLDCLAAWRGIRTKIVFSFKKYPLSLAMATWQLPVSAQISSVILIMAVSKKRKMRPRLSFREKKKEDDTIKS